MRRHWRRLRSWTHRTVWHYSPIVSMRWYRGVCARYETSLASCQRRTEYQTQELAAAERRYNTTLADEQARASRVLDRTVQYYERYIADVTRIMQGTQETNDQKACAVVDDLRRLAARQDDTGHPRAADAYEVAAEIVRDAWFPIVLPTVPARPHRPASPVLHERLRDALASGRHSVRVEHACAEADDAN